MYAHTIIVATKNKHKVMEMRDKCSAIPGLNLVPLTEFGEIPDIEENGATFEENARIKATAIAAMLGRPTLADDSGLVVDALDGRPGIYSARYGGAGLTDHDRNLLLLEELRGVAPERRTARFVCVIVLVLPGGESFAARGECEGRIIEAPRGDQGFGYDPVFFLPGYGMTMAELPLSEKNRISHRARAIDGLEGILRKVLDERNRG